MILYVFEGEKRDPSIFKSMQRVYFPNTDEQVTCSYGNNLYSLYKELKALDGFGDIVSLLRKNSQHTKNNPFGNISNSATFSEIYLFFDYDCHADQLNEINKKVDEMLAFFDNETENGKLYVHYPMVEAIWYTRQLPDKNFSSYRFPCENCAQFKRETAAFSAYPSLQFLCGMDIEEIKKNWRFIVKQHIKKASYICCGKEGIPEDKGCVSQKKIFNAQKVIVQSTTSEIAILSGFPLFLFDYFRETNKLG